MFTGIIETQATVQQLQRQGSNLEITLRSELASELRIDQSVSHNGVCLTVTGILGDTYSVTAVQETLEKTNLNSWQVGDQINLERSLVAGGRLDGHFVQGHVDTTAVCTDRQDMNGSWLFTFSYPKAHAALIIEKGSICLNGVALTVFNVTNSSFTVTIIPYTYSATNFCTVEPGSIVNVEFDVLGKYVNRIAQLSFQ